MKTIILILSLFPALSLGADDPSIAISIKKGVQKAMSNHIAQVSEQSRYPIFNLDKRKLEKLKFSKLHAGVVKKGDYYVSCADFVKDGKVYDVDFLVAKKGKDFQVIEALIHSVDGVKSKYDVGH